MNLSPEPEKGEGVEEIKDWIETCLDADAHGKWIRAPKFEVIEDVAELIAPRFVERIRSLLHREREATIKMLDSLKRKGGVKNAGYGVGRAVPVCADCGGVEECPCEDINSVLSEAIEKIRSKNH